MPDLVGMLYTTVATTLHYIRFGVVHTIHRGPTKNYHLTIIGWQPEKVACNTCWYTSILMPDKIRYIMYFADQVRARKANSFSNHHRNNDLELISSEVLPWNKLLNLCFASMTIEKVFQLRECAQSSVTL